MNLFVLFCCLYLYLALPCAAHDINADDQNHGTCQNLEIIMVQNLMQTGMDVRFYQASTTNLSTSTLIPNKYLPPECGENYHRCDILHFEHSGISYYILPSIRGFITLSYRIGDTHEEPQMTFVNITEECNPVQAFLTGPEGSNRIIIACMELQTHPLGTIYYLQYYFSPGTDSEGQSRGVIRKSTSLQIKSEPIYDPDTVSKVIYVHGQKRCEERRNLYFIDDAYVLQYPPDAFDPEYILSSDALRNCIGYQDIEHYGNDNLLIRCFNNQIVVYDSCTGHFNYSFSDRVPYPCSNWDTIIYREGRQLTLHERQHNNDTQQGTIFLPFDDLMYGTCIHAHDGIPTFVGIANDGAVFAAIFGGSNINITLRNGIIKNKTSSRGNGSIPTWDRPVFSADRQVFGLYNIANENSFLIVNVTAECTLFRRIRMSDHFTPNLAAFVARNGSYNYSCQRSHRAQEPEPIIHGSISITKWLPYGVPAIIVPGLLLLIILFAISGWSYVGMRKLRQRGRSLRYTSFHLESRTSRGLDIICTSSSRATRSGGHHVRQLSLGVHTFPLTMPHPVEAEESHNIPNNENSA